MKLFASISRLFVRFRYPVSLPEEIASDLGLKVSNRISFKEFIAFLTDPSIRPTKLTRFMPRTEAEVNFRTALRKECFTHHSLFSYYFTEGWMEFILQFDDASRLRRLYIRHKELKKNYEIPIAP